MKIAANSKGFTLIEVIVVMAVFLFIIGSAFGFFISIAQHQKRILAEQQLMNQTSYLVEHMSKGMRMAKEDTGDPYDCLVDDSGETHTGSNFILTRHNTTTNVYEGIKFINQSDDDSCYEIYLDDDGIMKETKTSGSGVVSEPIALTSDKVKINSLRFSINGKLDTALQADEENVQPRITILLEAQVPNSVEGSVVKIQTTVSQRNLNVQ